MKMIVEGGGDNFFLLMSCVLRYRQKRSSLLLKFLPELFGLDPMFSTKPDVLAVLSTAIISENWVYYREMVYVSDHSTVVKAVERSSLYGNSSFLKVI